MKLSLEKFCVEPPKSNGNFLFHTRLWTHTHNSGVHNIFCIMGSVKVMQAKQGQQLLHCYAQIFRHDRPGPASLSRHPNLHKDKGIVHDNNNDINNI